MRYLGFFFLAFSIVVGFFAAIGGIIYVLELFIKNDAIIVLLLLATIIGIIFSFCVWVSERNLHGDQNC